MSRLVFVCFILLSCSSNVFHIESTVGNDTWSGTAFFVNDTGLALTASHVLTGMTDKDREAAARSGETFRVGNIRAFLWWTGRERGLPARPVVVDLENDIALIQVAVKSSRPVAPSCRRVTQGNPVSSIGLPGYETMRRSGRILDIERYRTPPKIIISNETRKGFSGGLAITRGPDDPPADTCTIGVIVQNYPSDKRGVVNPVVFSESVTKVLLREAPEFLRNFKGLDTF